MAKMISSVSRMTISGASREMILDLRFLSILLWISLLLFVSGCAPSSNVVVDDELIVNQRRLDSYRRLVVTTFQMQKGLYTDQQTEKPGSREARYAEMPQKLAGAIERELRERKLFPEILRSVPERVGSETLILAGRFTRIGRFRVSVEASLVDASTGREQASFKHTLWDVLDTNDSIGDLGEEIATYLDRIHYR